MPLCPYCTYTIVVAPIQCLAHPRPKLEYSQEIKFELFIQELCQTKSETIHFSDVVYYVTPFCCTILKYETLDAYQSEYNRNFHSSKCFSLYTATSLTRSVFDVYFW